MSIRQNYRIELGLASGMLLPRGGQLDHDDLESGRCNDAGGLPSGNGRVLRTIATRRSGGETVELACLDLEGVLIPEIWISFAEQTGIDELRLTTRDLPDYDELMRRRLRILEREGLGISDIQKVIGEMTPLEGASECLDWLREKFQVIILSDTFYEFAAPFMRQLGWPTLFCHSLMIDASGRITGYQLRQKDPKRNAVRALRNLNFRVIASGDSYNDTTMLEEADAGILFCPPDNVIEEFPQYPVTRTYAELQAEFTRASTRDL